VPKGAALLRSGASPGDDIWVSGTLGDAALGLAVLRSELAVTENAGAYLIERYRLPQPRLALGQALRGVASAAIDISDGLVADLAHILEASAVGGLFRADQLPLSIAARDLRGARDAALAGGDDYELLFTAPPARRAEIEALARPLDLPLTRIGEICAGSDLSILDARGQKIEVTTRGWQHF
jgi:thiamine-monophosphate kinase